MPPAALKKPTRPEHKAVQFLDSPYIIPSEDTKPPKTLRQELLRQMPIKVMDCGSGPPPEAGRPPRSLPPTADRRKRFTADSIFQFIATSHSIYGLEMTKNRVYVKHLKCKKGTESCKAFKFGVIQIRIFDSAVSDSCVLKFCI